MSDIKLVSEEYTSKFVTGPALDQKLVQKQDKLSWYHEPEGYPFKVDIAANEVTLRAGGDTVGMIAENVTLSLSEEDGQISITSNFGRSNYSHLNILKTEKEPSSSPLGYNEKIVIGDSDNSTSIFVAGPLYDKNRKEITGGSSSFNYISEREGSHTSLLLGSGVGGNVRSVFVCGPLYGNDGTIFVSGPIVFNEAYDKDGKEITGSDSNRVTTDSYGRTLILGKNSSEGYGALVIDTDGEFEAELSAPMIYASGSSPLYIGGVDNFINFYQNYTAVDGHVMRIKIGTEELVLNQTKLQKLKQLLES